MRELLPELFILSAERSELDVMENERRSIELLDNVEHLPHIKANGVYSDTSERALVLFNESLASEMASQFNQECYLKRHRDGSCYLVYKTHSEYCGQWRELRHKPSGDHVNIKGRYFKAS